MCTPGQKLAPGLFFSPFLFSHATGFFRVYLCVMVELSVTLWGTYRSMENSMGGEVSIDSPGFPNMRSGSVLVLSGGAASCETSSSNSTAFAVVSELWVERFASHRWLIVVTCS